MLSFQAAFDEVREIKRYQDFLCTYYEGYTDASLFLRFANRKHSLHRIHAFWTFSFINNTFCNSFKEKPRLY
jgi:hypothetical protein